jgi:hypothetical protein
MIWSSSPDPHRPIVDTIRVSLSVIVCMSVGCNTKGKDCPFYRTEQSVQAPGRSGRPLSAPTRGAIVCVSVGCRLRGTPKLT